MRILSESSSAADRRLSASRVPRAVRVHRYKSQVRHFLPLSFYPSSPWTVHRRIGCVSLSVISPALTSHWMPQIIPSIDDDDGDDELYEEDELGPYNPCYRYRRMTANPQLKSPS
jgi:hypothetical protein